MKKIIVVMVILACLSTVWWNAYKDVNEKYPAAKREAVKEGEVLKYDELEFTVTSSEEYDYEGLINAYPQMIEIDSLTHFNKFYEQKFLIIDLLVKNNGTQAKEPELYQLVAGNKTTTNGIDVEMFYLLNENEGLLCPNIEPGQEIKVRLTYSYLDMYFGNGKNSDKKELIISLYPVRRAFELY